jgi:large subunit ribosomal protein L4
MSELREDIFGVEVKKHVLWEVVKWQLASRRQGTHSTKTRGEVAYSGRKLLPQKGTGNARHGDRGANIFVGGGVAHGPKPRDYYYPLPKKVRKLALKMALSSKAQQKAISLVDQIPSEMCQKLKRRWSSCVPKVWRVKRSFWSFPRRRRWSTDPLETFLM